MCAGRIGGDRGPGLEPGPAGGRACARRGRAQEPPGDAAAARSRSRRPSCASGSRRPNRSWRACARRSTARQPVEDEARASLKRLENVIAGSSTRGAAGENILEEALRHLPPEMLQRNVWVGGKVVELALRLPGGKLHADGLQVGGQRARSSSWPTPGWTPTGAPSSPPRSSARSNAGCARSASTSTPPPHRLSRWRSSPTRHTTCAGARSSAPISATSWWSGYAMALPYLLTLYQLHLQFARTVDMEKLQSALIDVERHLDTLEGILENKLQRAVTMLQNAYSEGKQVSARIRASAQSVQVSGPGLRKTFPQSPWAWRSSIQLSRPVLPSFPSGLPTLCPPRHQGYPQVIHQHVGGKRLFRPHILCFGLDKPKARSYSSSRYIEALGHKWRACSGASCIPKRTSSTTQPTSQQTDWNPPSPGMIEGGVL